MTKLRTVTFLTREQIDFLDRLGKDALFYNGSKLSRAHILAEMVDLLMQLGIDVKNIDLAQGNHLARAILKAMNNGHNGNGEDRHEQAPFH
jgi:hypothetical protein